MTLGPHAHRLHPPKPPTPMPAKPEDVGCVCGLYEPNRHACHDCFMVAIGAAED